MTIDVAEFEEKGTVERLAREELQWGKDIFISDFVLSKDLPSFVIILSVQRTSVPEPFHPPASIYCIFSLAFIKLPMNVTISRLRMLVISSGTSQIVAPIFLAMEMASLAFWYFSSSVLPGATSS